MSSSTERPNEGHSPAEEPTTQGIEISITPQKGIIFRREPDNSLIISGAGEFRLKLQLPQLPILKEEEAATSLFQVDTPPLPDSSEAVRGESRVLHAEQPGATTDQAAGEAAESPVPPLDEASSGLVPDYLSLPATEPHSAADEVPNAHPEHQKRAKPEDKDTEHVFAGTLTGEPRRPKRRDGKKVVQFDLAVPTDTGEADVKQFRVFRQLASHTWNRIQEGETDFRVRAYGPKHYPEWKENAQGKLRPTGEYTAGYYAYVINGVSNKSLAAQERKTRQQSD